MPAKKDNENLSEMQLMRLAGALNMDSLRRIRNKSRTNVQQKIEEELDVKKMKRIALQYKIMRVEDISKDTKTSDFAKRALAMLLE